MLRVTALAGCLIIASVAAAESAPAASCGDAPNQMEANACVSAQLARADADLNRLYEALTQKLDALGQRNLKAAERAWITFRDQECNFRSGYDTEHADTNGTIAPMLIGQCRTDLTRLRIKDLQAQMKCPGGDLSCTP